MAILRKKIGLWIPEKGKHPAGKMENPVRSAFLQRLKKENRWELFEDLDFTRAVIKSGSIYIDDFCLSDLDLYFWYAKGAMLSYNYNILKNLARKVTVINDPPAYYRGLDKLSSNMILHQHGIAAPEFAFISARNVDQSYKLLEQWGTLLLKPRQGSFGIGIVKINDQETLRDVIGHLGKEADKGFYLERYISNDIKKWCGMTVVNNQILFGYRKRPTKIADWRVLDTNKEGGDVDYVEPTTEQRDLALKAAQAFQLDITGVDIIMAADGGYYIVDVHTLPGFFPELMKQSGVDGVEELIGCIKNKI
ncbi:hypothetical protein KJ903_05155 [Patescibacteria group bacterium]|nr:hypothetical protein [Patescibacteria group bacterium]